MSLFTFEHVFALAQRYVGTKEVKGTLDNPVILAMLKLDMAWPEHDEVPWCSAFVNYICWLASWPRSKNLMARSWLEIGRETHADVDKQIVVLKRGDGEQPGPGVIDAPGHVGFYAGEQVDPQSNIIFVNVLGGNQGDKVSVATFPRGRVLSFRRLI